MDFGEAFKVMKEGRRIARAKWGGRQWLRFYPIPARILIVVYVHGRENGFDWAPIHSDLVADDWEELADLRE